MTAPATATVSGTFTPSTFTANVGASFSVGPRETAGEGTGFSGPASSPFSFSFPLIPGATYAVGYDAVFDGGATGGEGRFGLLDAGYDFVVAGEPILVAPADGATFTPGMQFSWSGPSAGLYRFDLRRIGPAAPAFYTLSKETSGATYTWEVRYLPGVKDVDQAMGPLGLSAFGRVLTSRSITVP
jgi:hypothetical protein